MSYREGLKMHPLIYVNGESGYGVDRETGDVVWTFTCPRRIARMLLAYSCAYFLDTDCVVHCVRAEDGHVLGKTPAGDPSGWGAALLAEDGLVYIATTKGLCALTPDGTMKWQKSHATGSSGALPGLGLPGQTWQPDFKD